MWFVTSVDSTSSGGLSHDEEITIGGKRDRGGDGERGGEG